MEATKDATAVQVDASEEEASAAIQVEATEEEEATAAIQAEAT